jgi:hypothetical protein
VAIDPSPPARPSGPDTDPHIDNNEIAAYRAISPLSTLSLIAGLGSILTFTSPYFAILGLLAIVLGLMAHRSIRKLSDVLTGEKLANVGIGLGLMFSLSALTLGFVQDRIVLYEASKFGRIFNEILQKGSTDDALFMKLPPAARKGKKAEVAVKEMVAQSRNPLERDQQQKSIQDVKARLNASADQVIDFDGVIQHSVNGLTIYAFGRYKLHGPPTKNYPNETQYALVKFQGVSEGSVYNWYVEEVTFPFTPSPAAN